MLKIIVSVLVGIILCTPILTLGAEPFRFAFLCDGRAQKPETCRAENAGVSEILGVAVQDILDKHAKNPIGLMLFPGDLISGYYKRDASSTAECNRIQFARWKEMVDPLVKAGVAIKVTAGNHDVATSASQDGRVHCGQHNRQYVTSPETFQVLAESMKDFLEGEVGPASDMGLTYSFDRGGCHFAVLTAYTLYENNSFSQETMAWLDKDLRKAADGGKPCFVVSHPPAFPGGGHMYDSLPFYDPTFTCDGYSGIDRRKERDRFWNILKKHKVVAYLCGHEHNIQVQLVEGVWHVISGGLTRKVYALNGAKKDHDVRNRILYDGEFQNTRASMIWPWNTKERASYWGWCLFTVDGDKVTMEVFGTDEDPCPGKGDNPCQDAKFGPVVSFTLREGSAAGGKGR